MPRPLESFEERGRLAAERARRDAEEFERLDSDLCMLCLAHGEDKRNLLIDCFYDLKEVVPEMLQTTHIPNYPDRGYYLRICKGCRGVLVALLEEWRRACLGKRGLPKDSDGNLEPDDPMANIPVRVNGAICMLTAAQYEQYRAQRERPEDR